MTVALETSGRPAAPPARRPRGPRLILYAVVIVALVFLLQRLFRDDAPLEERRDRLAQLEKRRAERVEGGTAAGPAVPTLVARWNGLRRGGGQPWRLRYVQPEGVPDRPPEAPADFAARFDEATASIVLTWRPSTDADRIVVHRSGPDGGSAETVSLDGGKTTWREPVRSLRGESVYWLQARRDRLRSPDSPRESVSFSIPYRLALREVDLARKTAAIAVLPRPGPRPAGFVGAEFRVQVTEFVGARTGSFDYTTSHRLLDLGELETIVQVRREVESFAPDGTRLRDGKGKPQMHWRLMPRSERVPFADVRTPDGKRERLRPDR